MSVTLEDLARQWELQQGRCALTGWELNNSPEQRNPVKNDPRRASLDRIDSSRGYEPGNIQWLAAIANYAKNVWDDATVVEFAAAVTARAADPVLGSWIGH